MRDQQSLQKLFNDLLAMETDGVPGNAGGGEVVFDVQEVVVRLVHPGPDGGIRTVHRGPCPLFRSRRAACRSALSGGRPPAAYTRRDRAARAAAQRPR